MSPEPALLHWEDIVIGNAVTFGRYVVSTEEVIDYARAFDPQPFHMDEAAAAQSPHGRLYASGLHSCAMMMRLLAENVLNQAAALGSPGLEDCAWIKPAFPGDVLSGRYTCTGKRVMRSRPDVGVCQFAFETLNQNGEVIMTWKAALFFQVRAPGAAS